MSPPKITLLIASLLCLQPVFAAAPFKCTGVDPAGYPVTVSMDSEGHKLVINGDDMEILSNTASNGTKTITTENDVTDTAARHVLIVTGNKGVLNKVNLNTNSVMSSLPLKCVFTISSTVSIADASSYLVSYTAEISHGDRYDENGQRLTSLRAILREDRARYHNHLSHDLYDSDDHYFLTTEDGDLFDTDKIIIDPALERKILGNGDVYIKVYVNASKQMTVVEAVNPLKSPSPPSS
jgi:hypothetical protein